MTGGRVLLSGIVGSVAYGLSTPESDVDRLGMYAAPSVDFFGLHPPSGKQATEHRTDPDVTLHELGKFLGLCLSCNPTVSELLWLPDELYDTRTGLGDDLIRMRSSLLCARRVRDAYLGYATSQFVRLQGRGRFPDVPMGRVEKHARHLLRLLDQGLRLYTTGELRVRVDDPARYHDFGQMAPRNPREVERTMRAYRDRFDEARSPLPERSDEESADRWLRQARQVLLNDCAPRRNGDGR